MTRAVARGTSRWRCSVLSGAALIAMVPVARAQTRFAWPTRAPAYAAYDVEECAAAVYRTQRQAAWGARDDTLTVKARLLRPEPPIVVETAKQCSAHLGSGQLPASAQSTLWRLWLVLGEDRRYAEALRTRLAQTPERAGVVRDAVARAVVGLLHDVHPVRPALADTLANELDRLGPPAAEVAFGVHSRLATAARDLGDSALADRQVKEALKAGAALRGDSTWARRELQARGLLTSWVLWTQHLITPDALLRRDGPKALLDAWRHDASMQAQASHLNAVYSAELVGTAGRGGGRAAPPLPADSWFYRADSTAYPRKGVVSLVMFVEERCGAACYPYYGALQRLKGRFGDGLELVLVASTKGYFRQRPPLDLPAEAEALREYFLDRLKLRATLAVVNAPFTTLPSPDGRRFYNQPALFAAYDVQVDESRQGHPPAFLIAADGLIVGRRDLLQDEVELEHLVADLLAYQRDHT